MLAPVAKCVMRDGRVTRRTRCRLTGKQKITDYAQDLERGKILRCELPDGEVVELMLVHLAHQEGQPYALLNVSGYKAGLIYSMLPDASRSREAGYAVDRDWLIANWSSWGCFECPLERVYMVDIREG